jgi:hypothetical protein
MSDQNEKSLGPWEPSITGKIPHEEVTKVICDFLFQQVVMRKDIGAGPAGGAATGQGAILEIEAKLGQIVDRNRGERLRLPVLTECVISKDDPSIRTAFESSMTLVTTSDLSLSSSPPSPLVSKVTIVLTPPNQSYRPNIEFSTTSSTIP